MFSLTEFIQFAEMDLLPLAVIQVGMECGAHQRKPTNLGCLQVQAVFTLQPPNPLKTQPQQRFSRGWDKALHIKGKHCGTLLIISLLF